MRRPLRLRALALIVGMLATASASALTLPEGAVKLVPEARESGGGAFRFFGLLIYDARLWTSGARFDDKAPFALGIRYARNIKGATLAEESVNQWHKMRYGLEGSYAGWAAQMRRVFPDVQPGDELVGVSLPSKGVRFFFNGVDNGEISDPAFARAFFAIWLDARTTEPGLRRALIGEK
jgi:hypothetical protein